MTNRGAFIECDYRRVMRAICCGPNARTRPTGVHRSEGVESKFIVWRFVHRCSEIRPNHRRQDRAGEPPCGQETGHGRSAADDAEAKSELRDRRQHRKGSSPRWCRCRSCDPCARHSGCNGRRQAAALTDEEMKTAVVGTTLQSGFEEEAAGCRSRGRRRRKQKGRRDFPGSE